MGQLPCSLTTTRAAINCLAVKSPSLVVCQPLKGMFAKNKLALDLLDRRRRSAAHGSAGIIGRGLEGRNRVPGCGAELAERYGGLDPHEFAAVFESPNENGHGVFHHF